MGIDISKLEGLMKTLATLSDVENKDGQIEGKKEVSIFKGYAENALLAGQITEKKKKKVFGLETTETKPATQTETVTTNPMSRKERRVAKKEANDREDAVKEAVEEAKAKAAEVDEPQTGQEETAEQDTAESKNAETDSQSDAENSGSDREQTEEDESGSEAQDSKADAFSSGRAMAIIRIETEWTQ